jgi:hypothetical protein
VGFPRRRGRISRYERKMVRKQRRRKQRKRKQRKKKRIRLRLPS